MSEFMHFVIIQTTSALSQWGIISNLCCISGSVSVSSIDSIETWFGMGIYHCTEVRFASDDRNIRPYHTCAYVCPYLWVLPFEYLHVLTLMEAIFVSYLIFSTPAFSSISHLQSGLLYNMAESSAMLIFHKFAVISSKFTTFLVFLKLRHYFRYMCT